MAKSAMDSYWAPTLTLLKADLALLEGRVADARSELQGILDRGGEEARADALARLGDVALREGDAAGATLHLEAAAKHDLARRPVARGLYAFTLARALWATGGEEARIAGLLDEAVQAYTVLGAPYAGRVAAIEAWRAGPR